MDEQRPLRRVGDSEQAPGLPDLNFLDDSWPPTRDASLRAVSDLAGASPGDLITQFWPAFRLLDEYDHGTLSSPVGSKPVVRLGYNPARSVVDELRSRFPNDTLFGAERGDAFRGILGAIEQTYAGEDVYPSTQRKAAHLL